MNDKAKEEKQSGNEDSMGGKALVDNENSYHEIDGGVQNDHTKKQWKPTSKKRPINRCRYG